MSDNILVINAGSSSVKFALYDVTSAQPAVSLRGQISGIGTSPEIQAFNGAGDALATPSSTDGIDSHDGAFAVLMGWLEQRGDNLIAAGHRIVHGGGHFTEPIRLDDVALKALEGMIPLAPHHQPHNLAAIRALASRFPDLPQVACFDTAFHAHQPPEAQELGLPRAYQQKGLRRYGFHGLSYESVLTALPGLTGRQTPARLVIAHLGNGASMCAVEDGRCVATTMGFSTLDGLPMATRSGAIDPGVLLHLMREEGAGIAELEDLLYNKSGLLGVSGFSQDMRTLLSSNEKEAAAAVSFYCYRISRELGSLAAALGGLDALVFTGGIGENAAQVRAKVLERSSWLGLNLDEKANNAGETVVTLPDSPTVSWIIRADEERIIASHTRRVLGL